MARTRFQRADQADSDCTPGAEANKPLLSTQTGGNETISITTQQGQMINSVEIGFTTASGDPGTEDLGAGSLFRCQLDITAIGANQSVRVVFHAVNDACTSQGSVAMTEGDFTATGLQLATATWDPPAADRYQARIGVAQGGMHTDPDETLTIRTNNSNAFYEFPDAPVAVGAPVIPQLKVQLIEGPKQLDGARVFFLPVFQPFVPPPGVPSPVIPFYKAQWIGDEVQPYQPLPRFFPLINPAPPAFPNPVIPFLTTPIKWWNQPLKESSPWDPSEATRFIKFHRASHRFSIYESFLQFDAAQYTTPTVFLEVIMSTNGPWPAVARLFNITDGVEETRITTNSTTPVRLRSAALTLSGADEYRVEAGFIGGTTTTIGAARLIVRA